MPKRGKTSAIPAQDVFRAARIRDLTRYPIETLLFAPFPVGAGLFRFGKIPTVGILLQKAREGAIGRFRGGFSLRNRDFVRLMLRFPVFQQLLDSDQTLLDPSRGSPCQPLPDQQSQAQAGDHQSECFGKLAFWHDPDWGKPVSKVENGKPRKAPNTKSRLEWLREFEVGQPITRQTSRKHFASDASDPTPRRHQSPRAPDRGRSSTCRPIRSRPAPPRR